MKENKTIPNSYTIAAADMEELRKKFSKYEKKAKKFGLPAPALDVGPVTYFEVPKKRRDDIPVFIEVHQVSVIGVAPKLEGWTFLGKIDLTEDTPLMRSAPGQTMPLWARDSVGKCGHCNLARRRNNTYALRHDDGREIEVGGNCLADFLGVNAEFAVQAMELYFGSFEALAEMDDDFDYDAPRGTRPKFMASTLKILEVTNAVIRGCGWQSKSSADAYNSKIDADSGGKFLTPTSSIVLGVMFPYKGERERDRKGEVIETNESDHEEAAKALEWLRNELPNKKNLGDYEYNLCTIFKKDMIGLDRMGLAASGMQAYARHMGQVVERAQTAKKMAMSEHFGAVKEKVSFKATILMVRRIETAWGVSTLVRMQQDNGNIAVWFASADPKISTGDVVAVTGKVKKHDVYMNVKQTSLTHCKISKEG